MTAKLQKVRTIDRNKTTLRVSMATFGRGHLWKEQTAGLKKHGLTKVFSDVPDILRGRDNRFSAKRAFARKITKM